MGFAVHKGVVSCSDMGFAVHKGVVSCSDMGFAVHKGVVFHSDMQFIKECAMQSIKEWCVLLYSK